MREQVPQEKLRLRTLWYTREFSNRLAQEGGDASFWASILMKKLYTIYAASEAEANEGWVWLKDPDLPTRTIVKIQNVTTGDSVFCESRKIDAYFLENCKETRGFKPQNPNDALFISAWYRDALGGFDPTSHSKKTVELSVARAKGWLWKNLRAASHHPDVVARLGTGLGVIGVWLGGVALAPIILEFTEWPKCLKLFVLAVFAVVLAAVGAYACRGVNRQG